MAKAKPFTWVVRYTVAPLWVQDGFALCNERALAMLAHEIGAGTHDELQAQILEAPSPLHIVRMQGYAKSDARGGAVAKELVDGAAGSGVLREALIAARDLLDSVAFVSTEGDTVTPLAKINAALDAIEPRRGDAVEIEQ